MKTVSKSKAFGLENEFFYGVFNVTDEKEHTIDYIIDHYNGDDCLKNPQYAAMHKASVRDAELAAISEDSPLEGLHF